MTGEQAIGSPATGRFVIEDDGHCPACRRPIPLHERGYMLLWKPECDAYDAVCEDCTLVVLRAGVTQMKLQEALEDR